ncbi:phage holin family protein [Cellulomonas gilvus]|uniref:Type I phosphodiesterase/nucleotide pyrophosphatase n=1 Tax=Cellulomonas gilvus (strain ATCC 13127 / NRRL B-14078) TaxID=593907 RepID=F7ZZQ6_CELGA|nr:phage holin family protein [Cellulomonas gilvus]AEI12549.1 type I phosphodiesterase/nucleotide pyrophosphatase [Cellulomonas gilvus ATCC 13127]
MTTSRAPDEVGPDRAGGSPAAGPRTRSRWHPTLGDLADATLGLVTTALGLGAAISLVDGIAAPGPAGVLLAAVLVSAGDLVVRAPLRALARVLGAMGALLLGLVGQVAIAWAALMLVPGIEVTGAGAVPVVIVLSAVVMAAGRWLIGANDSDYVIGDVLRRARNKARRAGAVPHPDRPPGLLVVQLDGVSEPVLREAVEAGLAPTMQRWLTEGTHRLETWWARVPSTTPASQAGLLHGDSTPVPAFRWWDRGLGRLVVTNHPADAALVEERLTSGRGLLAGGGTAVQTMFTGDAARSYAVMSRARTRGPDGSGAGLGPGADFVRFFASPFVLARAVSLTVGEMVKELYQARRQHVRGVEPRISRGGWYVLLRAVTNVLMRDLATSLVAEAVVRGDPAVFVDLVDYDEIAHHAGPTRPESMRALEGLDRVLRTLEHALAVAPRAYRVVVLSDHGQALGATFEQVEGCSLLETVRALMAEPDAAGLESGTGEDWGPLNALVTSVTGSAGSSAVGPDARERSGREPAGTPDVVVVGSGNLGLIWFPRADHRLVLEELEERWPGLVAGLASRPAIGAVVVDTAARGLVAFGARGFVTLEDSDGDGEGEDPLAGYGPRGRADLARAARLPHTGDLLLVSRVTERGHVHAFEGQVGSHGGIGGAQNRAMLLHPTEWPVDDDLRTRVGDERLLVGAEAVHEQLVRWARRHGLRDGLDDAPAAPLEEVSP